MQGRWVIVTEGDISRASARERRRERNLNGAVRRGSQRCAAIVSLRIIATGNDAVDIQRGAARIRERYRLSRARGHEILRREAEGQGRNRCHGAARSSGSSKSDHLGTSRCIIGNRDRSCARSRSSRTEHSADGAVRSCDQRSTAVVCLGKVAGVRAYDHNAGNGQRSIAGVEQSYTAGGATGAHGLIGKGKTGRTEADQRRSPAAGKPYGLRAA